MAESPLVMRWLPLAAVALLAACASPIVSQGPMTAFHTGDRILFQGDSITDGGRQRTGDDLNHIMGQDYAYIVAARVGAQLPERHLLFLNRGISGNRITDLSKRWQKDTLDLKPDILSILVGVNDGTSVVDKRPSPDSVADYAAIYDTLISQTLAALPHVRLVLCEPFAFPGGARTKDRWPERQQDLQDRCKAVEALAAKYHAPVVNFQKVFDEACKRAPASYWIWDGIHPTYAGHELMADEWLRVVTAFYAAPG
jgi:lysophospholipase L1-like esterase